MIEVVSAVIIRNGRILLTQRREDKDYPFMWECPGGKVDGLHESHHDALRRECMEELGLNVTIAPGAVALWCKEVERVGRDPIFLLMYRAVPYDSSAVNKLGTAEQVCACTPKPMEGQGIGWFTAGEMAALKLTPGNQAALGKIVASMGIAR